MLKIIFAILITLSVIQFFHCSTCCDFKKIFQTPVDSSRFDNYEILERANFRDDAKKPDSVCDTNLPKAFANAQVLVHVQNDKSKCKETCQISHPEPCHKAPSCQCSYPYPPTYPYPYPFPPYNPYIPPYPYPVYPPYNYNPYGNVPYPNWMVAQAVESKLVLDKPLVVLDEDPKTVVQIDDVFEIPCDTVIKTCECEDVKDDKECYDEEKVIEDILNYEGSGCKPMDDCDCSDICPELPFKVRHDCPYRKIVIEDYHPEKVQIPECPPKEAHYCPYCNKYCDERYCTHCQKTLSEPCLLEIPMQLAICPHCKKDAVTNSYCSHCKRVIQEPCKDVTCKPCDKLEDNKPYYPKKPCRIEALPSCMVLVDPSKGPPAPDCVLINADLIDLDKFPTRELSDILEREKIRKCQQGTQKCYRCQNCRKVRPLSPIDHSRTGKEIEYDGGLFNEEDDDDLPDILVEDGKDYDGNFQVFIYDPNMNTDGDDEVKELTFDDIEKATFLTEEAAYGHLKEITVDNTDYDKDDIIEKSEYLVPEEGIDTFLDNMKKRKERIEPKYYFLDGSKLCLDQCGCSCCSGGIKKPFKYDIDDLNVQTQPKCNLLPHSSPVAIDPLCAKYEDQPVFDAYRYSSPTAEIEEPVYGVRSTIPSLSDKILCRTCGSNPCKCRRHPQIAYPAKSCSCRHPCTCHQQVLPNQGPCNQGHYAAYFEPDNYYSNLRASPRCDQPPLVPGIGMSTNAKRPCSSCAPYIGELVTLSSY